jgi:predicted RNase H-like HicB family nuclease
MKYVYPACFYPEDDGRVSVIVPDFPLATFGDNLADAMYMAADAIAGRIFTALDEGENVPTASGIQDMQLDRADGFVSLVYVDAEAFWAAFDEKPIKKTLTIPSWLNRAAEKRNINFSAALKEALLEKVTVNIAP